MTKNIPNIIASSDSTIKIIPLSSNDYEAFINNLSVRDKNIIEYNGFKGQAGKIFNLYNDEGKIEKIIFGIGEKLNANIFGALSKNLSDGDYELEYEFSNEVEETNSYISFMLGAYNFDKYKSSTEKKIQIIIKNQNIIEKISIISNAIFMGRDLINTPTNDMGVSALAKFAKELANKHNAEVEEIIGDELLAQNYPLIHAVGKGSFDAPRLIILRIKKENAPKIAIVGKGVVFDTGGLNLKPGGSMGLMKKDMGGSACALTSFKILAQLDLDIDLSIYIPIVENSVSGNSMRPSDVVVARNGLSIEIDNTDAEGRLILADALAKASEDGAELIIDYATLTGAARVALGPTIPPFYTDDIELANDIKASSDSVNDPLWQLPLWSEYLEDLDSSIADMKNSGGGFAGSITAALFLQKFVNTKSWAHFDVYCWNPKDKPAKPKGAEIQAVRTIVDMLQKRYGK